MALFTNQMRFTGMSGLDVNDMVTQLMRAHSIRLDRLRQSRDILTWQQQHIRDVAADARALQNQFLNSVGANARNNIMMPSNFNSVTGAVTGAGGTAVNGVTINAAASSTVGNRNFEVISTAGADVFRAGASINRSTIEANYAFDFDAMVDNFTDNTTSPPTVRSIAFSVNMNGRSVTFNINEARRDAIEARAVADGISTNEAFAAEFNDWLGTTFGNASAGAAHPNGGMRHVWAELDSNGSLVVNVREGNSVSLANVSPTPSGGQSVLESVGFRTSVANPYVNLSTTFSQAGTTMSQLMGSSDGAFRFDVNGTLFDFDGTVFTVGGTVNASGGIDGGRTLYDGNLADNDLTVQQVVAAINANAGVSMTFNTATGMFTMASRGMGAVNGEVTFNDMSTSADAPLVSGGFFDRLEFGSNSAAIGAAGTDSRRVSEARDAVVILDDVTYERATNSFQVGDLNITLDPNANIPTGPLTINLTRDTSHAEQMIRDFIDHYNTLIRSIRDLTETRRPRQPGGGGFFMPLTDEQRRGMSDREVELWEEQARRGIMNRDDTLRGLTDQLHREIFRDVVLPDGTRVNLLHMGIRTHSDLSRFGELQIDEDRFNNFLENRLDDVRGLFTQLGTGSRRERLDGAGIGQRIDDIINWQLGIGGAFDDRAGISSTSRENNMLSRRIANEDRRIDHMIRDLQRREHRYFQTFGRLEAAMIQSNSQMMFMEQMFWMG